MTLHNELEYPDAEEVRDPDATALALALSTEMNHLAVRKGVHMPDVRMGVPVPTVPPDFMPMPMDVGRVLARVAAVEEIITRIMKPGIHYGPAFEGQPAGPNNPDALRKPGIDLLCMAFSFRIDFVETVGTLRQADHICIAYRADVVHIPTGRIIASAVGSANSREEKYRWARGSGKPSCPDCGVDQVWANKERDDPGFYCWRKKGGCGAKFGPDDKRITDQKPEKTENDNAWDHLNTLEKMAQKRAGMAAIVTACGISNRFSTGGGDDRRPPAPRNDQQQQGRWNGQEPPSRGQNAPPPPEEPPQRGRAQERTGTPNSGPAQAGTGTPNNGRQEPEVSEAVKQTIRDRCKPLKDALAYQLFRQALKAEGFPWWSDATKEVIREEYERKFPNASKA